jgi:hypothetical protein
VFEVQNGGNVNLKPRLQQSATLQGPLQGTELSRAAFPIATFVAACQSVTQRWQMYHEADSDNFEHLHWIC